MNDIPTNHEGNTEATLFNGDALKFINNIDIDLIKHRANKPGTQAIAEIIRRNRLAGVELAS